MKSENAVLRALIDPSFIRLCGQRYHARLGIEENSKRKFRAYYGNQWTNKTMQLETEQFLYLNKNKLETIRVPLFETERTPEPYTPPEAEKQSFWSRIFNW